MLRIIDRTCLAAILLTVGLLNWTCSPVAAAVRVEGQVQAGGGRSRKFHCHSVGRERGRTQATGSSTNWQ